MTAKLTDVLIAENTRLRSAQAEVAQAFLDTEKRRNETELAAREAELLRFLARHPEFAQEQQGAAGLSLRARPRVDLESDGSLAALRREELRLRSQIATTGQAPRAPRDPQVLIAARNEAETRLRTAQREQAEQAARFTRAASRCSLGGRPGQGSRGGVPARRRRRPERPIAPSPRQRARRSRRSWSRCSRTSPPPRAPESEGQGRGLCEPQRDRPAGGGAGERVDAPEPRRRGGPRAVPATRQPAIPGVDDAQHPDERPGRPDRGRSTRPTFRRSPRGCGRSASTPWGSASRSSWASG